MVVTQWATTALQNHKASKSLLSITGAEALKPNEKVTTASSSSSSSKKLSSLFIVNTLTPALPTTIFTKAKVKKTEVLDDAGDSVLQFFVSKKKKRWLSPESYGDIIDLELFNRIFDSTSSCRASLRFITFLTTGFALAKAELFIIKAYDIMLIHVWHQSHPPTPLI